MLKTIKITVMFMNLALFLLLPQASYAWEDQHEHDGRSHHGDGSYAHRNPDLTLVSGMEGIDNRVLVAADPDPAPEVIDQSTPAAMVISPGQTRGQDMDTFIVNVPNKNGGYTRVLIQKWGNGYLGPQGELYYPFPQTSQLKAMYGL